ncbi:MAG: S8 family serine peptidase [Planctomycetota bacterium]|nr:MAG: S8 family serine peptidase [Planctomycetota bacterium]
MFKSVCVVLVILYLTGQPLLATEGPFDTVAMNDRLMIVIDPRISASVVQQNLAAAGFTTFERIKGLPPQYHNYRMVTVGSANAATKEALLGVDGVLAVRPAYNTSYTDYPILLNGQVIVRFQPGTPRAQVNAIATQYNCMVSREISGLPQVYVFNVNENKADPYTCSKQILQNSNVVYCHPSILFKLEKHQASQIIEDTFYPFQWHLNNTGQLDGAVPDADIDAPEAWEITMGEGAVVAVIDDSIQRDHEDLMENYLTGYDFLGSEVGTVYIVDPDTGDILYVIGYLDPAGEDGDPSPFFGPDYPDPIGEAHGTAVSGVICARANTIGVRGVAPFAGLIGCKIGLGWFYTTDQDVADAFIFAERNGAMAINNSWGGPGTALLPVIPNASFMLPDLISDAIFEVATNGRSGLGCLVLFSAGNGDIFYRDPIPISYGNIYASMPNVLAVGATQRDDTVSCYSNYGAELSVMAPGGGIDAPRSQYGEGGQGSCFVADIATTDNMQVQGYTVWDFDGDGLLDPGWPIRGYNEMMKFLDVPVWYDPNDPWGIPLVPDMDWFDEFPNVNYTKRFNGTSAACPMVTGVAALVFSVNNNLTAREARNLIEHTADKIQAPNEWFDSVTGHNLRYGHGRVNAHRAVLAAQVGESWPSPVKNVQSISSQALGLLFWDNPDWDDDGVIDNDVAGVLVVRGPAGQLNWAPVDGIEYTVGQQVASGVIVVANDLIDELDQTGLPEGEFEYALFVRNASDYYSWGRRAVVSASGTVSVPLASIQASPKIGPMPLDVHFAGGGIDDKGLVSFLWDFGDGTTGSGATVDHTYFSPGEYTARLTVTNVDGLTASASTRIVVSSEGNLPPTVQIVANPNSGTAPLVVVFKGIADDPDGDNSALSYLWDFGDGSTATGQVVEHVYLLPGTYGVTLEVTDQSGSGGMGSALVIVGGSGVTAAETAPSDALNPGMVCGNGAAGSIVASLAGLMLLSFILRRR